jgi:hypothetical protein
MAMHTLVSSIAHACIVVQGSLSGLPFLSIDRAVKRGYAIA